MGKIHDLIEKRWSPRAFNEKEVPGETIKRLFEAARLSPSANNEQPWRFLLGIRGKDDSYGKLFESLNEFNQKWAVHAPIIAVVLARTSYEQSGKPNAHALYDCGQAVAYLTMQATDEGLFVHQMAGFFPEKIKETYDLPDGFEPIAAFVIGYKGNPEILPEHYQKMEFKKDNRKPLEQLVFKSWGVPAQL